jgi:1-acyl-sn-glycerol-3-phosphate acyltransferase
LTVLPLILLFSSTKEQKERGTLKLIHYAFKSFMKFMQIMNPIASFKIEGLEELRSVDGCVFIANHPTLIDVVAVVSILPLCHCIVKRSLLERFYLGWIMRAAGYIANDHATQLIEACYCRLQARHSLLIFPEGTRSPAHGLHPFNRGAAQVALRTGAPVVPIVITCEPPTLLRGQPWYAVPERPMVFTLRFYPPLAISAIVTGKQGFPLQVRALNQYFEDFFHRELQSALAQRPER